MKTRINILTTVNAAKVKIDRREIDGEKYAVIQNVRWMTDDIVLNDGLYPAQENAKGYASMEGRIMPFGHPAVNGQYIAISSLDNADAAKALGKHYGGVHAENVRTEAGHYYADVMINERVASAHPDGVALLEWAENAEAGKSPAPIQMSTGLMLERVQVNGHNPRGESYSWVASRQEYDHLAILLHEQGAGGDQVAIAVNCESVLQANLPDALADDSYENRKALLLAAARERYQERPDQYIWITDFDDEAIIVERDDTMFKVFYSFENGMPILGAEEGQVVRQTEYVLKQNQSRLSRFWNMLQSALKQNQTTEETQEMTPEELQSALNAQAEQLQGAFNAEIAALKAEITANQSAEKRKAVAAKFGDVVANALQGEALDAAFAQTQTAADLAKGFQGNAEQEEDEFKGYSLNRKEAK